VSLAQFKELLREQYLLLRQNEERAVAAIPKLLPPDAKERATALGNIHQIIAARGALTDAMTERLDRIEAMFKGGGTRAKQYAGEADIIVTPMRATSETAAQPHSGERLRQRSREHADK